MHAQETNHKGVGINATSGPTFVNIILRENAIVMRDNEYEYKSTNTTPMLENSNRVV